MESKNEMLVDPNIKKQINQEGFEGDAAVLIGKKEEMSQMEERLDKEGRAENLGTYIKMHKEIVLPNSEMDQDTKESILRNKSKGTVWFDHHTNDIIIYYIDKDKNASKVVIDPAKISSLKDALMDDIHWDRRKLEKLIKQELVDLGFYLMDQGGSMPLLINSAIINYKYKMKSDLENKKKQEFDL